MLTIRPALAATAASVTHCQIPVPDQSRGYKYVAADGTLVEPGTAGAFPPAGRPFVADEVKQALAGGRLPGTDTATSNAYLNYIRRLQSGTSGFTCFASLQMPRG